MGTFLVKYVYNNALSVWNSLPVEIRVSRLQDNFTQPFAPNTIDFLLIIDHVTFRSRDSSYVDLSSVIKNIY